MKKFLSVLFCMILISGGITAAFAQTNLAGTVWDLYSISFNGERHDATGTKLQFHFKSNGTYTLLSDEGTGKGTYKQSGENVDMDNGDMWGKVTDDGLALNIEGMVYTFLLTESGVEESLAFDTGFFIKMFWFIIAGIIVSLIFGLIIVSVKNKKKNSTLPPPTAPASLPPITPIPATMPVMQPSASSVTIHIKCTKGHYDGATFPINGQLTIGRDPKQCQLVFPNETEGISALHCEVRQQGANATLTDMGSTYGTFLNGRMLNRNENATLNSGDSFYLADGKNEFKML